MFSATQPTWVVRHPSIYLSIYRPTYLSIYLPTYLPAYLPTYHLSSIYLYFCLSVYQPAAIAPCSIALVNSVGNLGGFAGTFVLGYLHDALGRSDHAGTGAPASGGIGDWAGGTAALGLAFLLVTCVTGALLRDGTRGRFRP